VLLRKEIIEKGSSDPSKVQTSSGAGSKADSDSGC